MPRLVRPVRLAIASSMDSSQPSTLLTCKHYTNPHLPKQVIRGEVVEGQCSKQGLVTCGVILNSISGKGTPAAEHKSAAPSSGRRGVAPGLR